MIIFYNKLKKYYEIQLTKNKMDLNIRKMTHHPPFPETIIPDTGILVHIIFYNE